MIKEYLERLIEKQDLSIDESYSFMDQVMSGNVNNSHLAAFLVALKSKGETAAEVAGFAKAMKDKGIKINASGSNVIDVCGTGGDYSGTFNISTAVAFAAAGAGVKVAKHGNRSISSKCGSADVLQQLGIEINLSKEESEEALERIGITFLFAPNYHPAMKYAAPVRKELGIKTIFNMLGPLTNPADVKKQIIGTFSVKAARIMSQAVEYLGLERVCFICCCDRYDEVYLGDSTEIFEYNRGSEIKNYSVTNDTFGYPRIKAEDIIGGSTEENAAIILDIFSNGKKANGAFYTVAANTALALYCAGYAPTLDECRLAAEESIKSGAALQKLNQLKKVTSQRVFS